MENTIILLTGFAAFTGIVTEIIKTFLDEAKVKYSSNLVAFISGLLVGIIGTLGITYFDGKPITFDTGLYSIFMGLMSSFGAMVGYDKVTQALTQFGKDED